jgi:2-polyprenyl-3-methyl-5-hydroxy-6-metoxy-1,4-benzoquinol methylase
METWDKTELETILGCPICQAKGKPVYEDLTDIVFEAAGGKWTINQCQKCSSGFLNPRPNRTSIGKAYAKYYTHGDNKDKNESQILPTVGLLRKAINGRLFLKYGLKIDPHSSLLGHLLNAIPFIGHFFDPLGRSIDLPPHANASLLDFGCGDGRFLIFGSGVGWKAVGVDFDPAAVNAARAQGLNVRLGGFEAIQPGERFDLITLSHVIEHVHDPFETLQKCFSLLNDGGQIVVETPNFDAFGRVRFAEHWRGLECPRHLVLFTEASLRETLQRAGFTAVKCTSRPFISLSMYAESRRLRAGRPAGRRSIKDMLTVVAIYDGIRALIIPSRAEFLRFKARRP